MADIEVLDSAERPVVVSDQTVAVEVVEQSVTVEVEGGPGIDGADGADGAAGADGSDGSNGVTNPLLDGMLEQAPLGWSVPRTAAADTLAINADNTTGRTNPTSTDQAVDPCLVSVPSGFGPDGHTEFLFTTPYVGGDDAYENPSLMGRASRGDAWAAPTGLTNPIFVTPGGTDYNADVFGWHSQATGRLRLVYMEVDGSNAYLKYSQSGAGDPSTWAAATTWLTAALSGGVGTIMSPSVIEHADGSVEVYTVNLATHALERRTATSFGGALSSASAVTVNGMPSGRELWHAEVKRYGATYVALLTIQDTGGVGAVTDLYLAAGGATSIRCQPQPALKPSLDGWDSGNIYASTMEVVPGPRGAVGRLIYSAQASNVWGHGEVVVDLSGYHHKGGRRGWIDITETMAASMTAGDRFELSAADSELSVRFVGDDGVGTNVSWVDGDGEIVGYLLPGERATLTFQGLNGSAYEFRSSGLRPNYAPNTLDALYLGHVGAAAAQWDDQVGINHFLQASGPNQPTVSVDAATCALPSLVLGGGTKWMETGSRRTDSVGEVFWVGTIAASTRALYQGTDNNARWGFRTGFSSKWAGIFSEGGDAGDDIVDTNDGTEFAVGGLRVINARTEGGGTSYNLSVNGVTVDALTVVAGANSGDWLDLATGGTGMTVGKGAGVVQTGSQRTYAVAIAASELTAAQRKAVHDYLFRTYPETDEDDDQPMPASDQAAPAPALLLSERAAVVPKTKDSPGRAGQWAADDNFLYVRTANGEWGSVPLSKSFDNS